MRKIYMIATGIAITGSVVGQDYTIARWYNDFEACMVQTYDDMNSDHVNICTPQLHARGMGGTMFVDYDVPGHVTLSGGWDGLMDAVDKGMEMANHTETHVDLHSIANNPSELQTEINTFRDFLNSNVTNQDCNTFAYPYGNGNTTSAITNVISEHHIGARAAGLPGMPPWNYTQNWIYDFGDNDADYFQIPTIAEHFLKPKIQAEVDNLLQYGGLMTTMWHAVVASDHEQFLDDVLAACGGKVWHANFQDAIKYHKERRTATLTTEYESGVEWVLELTDALSDPRYDHPLTIHLKYGDVIVLGVKQNGVALDYTISGDEIIFNAVPDGGDIVIEKQYMVGQTEIGQNVIAEIFPNPVANELNLKLGILSSASVSIYNSLGVEVRNVQVNNNFEKIELSGLATGSYYVKVVDSETSKIEVNQFLKK